ncbi:sensor histidine kinase [Streptomyces sp. NPDC088725]|uniref:sensor histidine kinase n=1 Tax=Streptomyces sp. NPDC088725 TaxID=3365873 RepID=UPI00381EB101
MSVLTGWWCRKSRAARTKTAKVELYTRWSFHSLLAFEVGFVGLEPLVSSKPLGGWLFLLVCAHGTLCAVNQSVALDWRLGRRERPVRLLLSTAALSAASIVTVLALRVAGTIAQDKDYIPLVLGFAGFGVASVSLGLRTTSQRVVAVLATTVGTAVAGLLFGMGWGLAAAHVIGVLSMSTGLVVTYVFSAWLLSVVWELDAAREVNARLAVAEERLRFGRDLHDVMGRNLSVIALKSELAVGLAERGRPEAVAQMVEVQRMARESQREVREVVRGYREADLHTELEGARGVLKAAGIDCRIRGDGGDGLPAQVQSALAWVVREATTNVLRHGDARRCTVRLSESEGGEAVLVVENDGLPAEGRRDASGASGASGVSASSGSSGASGASASSGSATKGSGLVGLRERLALLDGTLDAGRAADGCFRLTARVPRSGGTGVGAGAASAVTATGVAVGTAEVSVAGNGAVA